jgi:hypothetical protein
MDDKVWITTVPRRVPPPLEIPCPLGQIENAGPAFDERLPRAGLLGRVAFDGKLIT